jgi:hypothetical protein
MKLYVVVLVIGIIGMGLVGYTYILPLLQRETYEVTIQFNVVNDVNFMGKGYFHGGSSLGPFELKEGQQILIELLEKPEKATTQYNYILLQKQETGEVVDVAKLQLLSDSKVRAPSQDNYFLSLGVIKTILYDQKNSEGLWSLKITIPGSNIE